MNIAYVDIYGHTYEKDGCFNADNCSIGQNLLLPCIMLKEKLQLLGHSYHTLDMYQITNVDLYVFQDVPNSLLTCKGFDKIKFHIKNLFLLFLKKERYVDKLKIVIKNSTLSQRLLIIVEPPTVCERSYKKEYHKYFNKIMTWDDNLVDNKKYFKYYYPQPKPKKKYYLSFEKKQFIIMIAGNKSSSCIGELYSKRLEAIRFLENKKCDFDLYGLGWNKDMYVSYKGRVDDKLEVLSHYKFSICFENMTGINGYVTEKIFDCFFANVVPIYLGANNITDYIPANCFIDYRKYNDLDDLYEFLLNITSDEYDEYLKNIKKYLKSKKFNDFFSVNAYVKRMTNFLLDN